MELAIRLTHALLAPAWTAAAAAYLLVFLRADPGAERWSRPLALAALALHVLAFGCVSAATGWNPPLVSAAGLVSGMAFATAAVYLYLEGRIGSRAIGAFPIALATVLVIVAATIGRPLERVAPELQQWPLAAHVLGAIFGYAGLLLSAVFGALFLIQRRSLRSHDFGLFWSRLPSLELLDQLCFRSLLAAFAFQTVTIGFGHVGRMATESPFPYTDPKILVSNGIWLAAGVIGVGRAFGKLRPRLCAAGALTVFCIAAATMHLVARGAV